MSRTVRRLVRLLVASTALVASAGLSSGTAYAGTPCGSTYTLCVYTDNYYEGSQLQVWSPQAPNYKTLDTIGLQKYNDRISSISSNYGQAICFYSDPHYNGLQFRIGPWEKWSYVPDWINDKISSFRPC
ncbi:peptidase inhibitor family I36 protein [Streptomyces sp. NPDC035033]|uniref:peptidase inhibitor family I36 protein n=1 Tax=Streptomyces sp. NPDC035033 TaxID=3155368 RepID=UPI0033D3AFB0